MAPLQTSADRDQPCRLPSSQAVRSHPVHPAAAMSAAVAVATCDRHSSEPSRALPTFLAERRLPRPRRQLLRLPLSAVVACDRSLLTRCFSPIAGTRTTTRTTSWGTKRTTTLCAISLLALYSLWSLSSSADDGIPSFPLRRRSWLSRSSRRWLSALPTSRSSRRRASPHAAPSPLRTRRRVSSLLRRAAVLSSS